MKIPRSSIWLLVVACLSPEILPKMFAQCIPGDVEYRDAWTNLVRAGYAGLDGTYDTYYGQREIFTSVVKEPLWGVAAYTNYQSYSVIGGVHYLVNTCSGWSTSSSESWAVDISGQTIPCHCESGATCTGADANCMTRFAQLFTTDGSEGYPPWDLSEYEDGVTNYMFATSNYKEEFFYYEYGNPGNWSIFDGTKTGLITEERSGDHTIEQFAEDTLNAARGLLAAGGTGNGQSVSLVTSACAGGSNTKNKMSASFAKYRIKWKSKQNVKYDVEWDVKLIYTSPTPKTNKLHLIVRDIRGNGTTNYLGWFEAPDPALEENFSINVENIEITPKDGGCAGTCGTTAGASPGEGSDYLDSAAFSISLGAGNVEDSAGELSMEQETPSANLATINALNFAVNPAVVTLSTNSGNGSIDVAAPTMLARVVTSNSYAYWVHCFPKVGGSYDTNAGFVSHLLINQNGSTNFNTLQHIQFRSGSIVTNEFLCETNHSTNTTWRLVSGNGLKGERLAKISTTSSNRLESYSVFESGTGQVLYKRDRLYWILQYGEFLLSETIDPGGLSLMTTNTYDAAGRLTNSLLADGSWFRNEYQTNGVLLRTVRPFTNQPPTAATNDCRVSEYSYASIASSGDDQAAHPGEPRMVTEFVQGQPVSTTMYAYSGNNTYMRVNANPVTSWTDSNNEKTDTYRDNQHRVTQIDHPDGTRTLITYSGGTTTTRTGVPVSGTIYPGTKTVQVVDTLGRLISVTTYDIDGGGTERITSQETYSDPDTFGRPTKITYLDGTSSTEVRQDCCQAAYSIDRDGVAATNSYDGLNRLVSTVRMAITNSTVFDAADRPLAFKRSASGSSIVQRGLVYDAAGRVTRETNALGGVTTYSNYVDGSSQSVKITTYPDGGARTEIYFRDGQLAWATNSAAFPARYEYGKASDGGYYRAFTKEIKLNTNLTDSSEWTKTLADGIGRNYKTVFPGGSTPYRQSFYNKFGQLWKERDPDGVVTLYGYNALGERAYTAIDSNRNDTIDFSGLDRITQTTNDVVSAHSTNVRRTRTYVWGTNNNSTATLLTTTEVSTDGLNTWQTNHSSIGSIVSSSATTIPTSGNSWTHTVTQTLPDNSTVVSVLQSGRLQSVTRKDSLNSQLSSINYSYDAHGRQYAVTDARNGSTVFSFNSADQIVTTTTPSVPGAYGSMAPQITTTFYDAMQRATGSLLPDGTTVTNEFYLNGLRKKTWGSRTYPVEYTYDYAGRMSTMKTWQNFAGNSGTAITTWNYDSGRGWLSNKRYADNYGPDYTYTDAGRLATRVWARSVGGNRLTTTYSYNDAGEMSGVSYNDGMTPSVTYSYDRRGRAVQIVRNGITTAVTYSEGGQLLREAYTGGTLDGLSVTNIYDSLLRRTNVSVKNGTSVLAGTGYGYDNASRLLSVTDGTNTATYSYIANSPLVGQIDFKNNGTTRMTTTKTYDKLNRLSTINNQPSVDSAVSFAYDYNSANQRTRVTLADGSYWIYTYDALGQVTSGRKYWSDGTLVAGQQFDYSFDDIGNRKQTKAGGDQNGLGKRVANYSVNDLNQYTQRDVPGGFDVLGVARGTVTVNANSAYRKGEYFRNEVSVSNGSTSQYQSVNVTTMDGSSVSETGAVFVAKTSEVFGYDLDGNMTNDGRWVLTWDAENRLVQMQSLIGAPVGSSNRLTFAYDHQGRRIQKKTEIFSGGTWTTTLDNRFVYDRWNVLAVLDSANALQQSFRWGKDLSGSIKGAGGVGGLIWITIHTGANTGVSFYGYDGNGNVATLVSAADGSVTAQYEYEPFGRLLRATGPLATINRIQFSTKYRDAESGWSEYGFRIYDSDQSRWLSRDPIEEHGGNNLYAFLNNNPVMFVDVLGAASMPTVITIVALEFRSHGRAVRDPWYLLDWDETESGRQKSASAFYSQSVRTFWAQGLCNSGGPPDGEDVPEPQPENSTSFVKADVKNKGCMCARVQFTCNVVWGAEQFGGVIEQPWRAQGQVLGTDLQKGDTTPGPAGPRPIVVMNKTVTAILDLIPGKWHSLYNVYPSVAMQASSGRQGFDEAASGNCTFRYLGPCSRRE